MKRNEGGGYFKNIDRGKKNTNLAAVPRSYPHLHQNEDQQLVRYEMFHLSLTSTFSLLLLSMETPSRSSRLKSSYIRRSKNMTMMINNDLDG